MENKIKESLLAELERLRSEVLNPKGFKKWINLSDKNAIRRIVKFYMGE